MKLTGRRGARPFRFVVFRLTDASAHAKTIWYKTFLVFLANLMEIDVGVAFLQEQFKDNLCNEGKQMKILHN